MATHFDLRRDYERGASVLELADREGVDCKTMRERLSRAGTKMRPRGSGNAPPRGLQGVWRRAGGSDQIRARPPTAPVAFSPP